MLKKILVISFLFVLLLSPFVVADTIDDVRISDMVGYKTAVNSNPNGDIRLMALDMEHCRLKPDHLADGYKECEATVMIWNKRSNAIPIDMSEDDFVMDIDIPIRDDEYHVYYSKNEYIYNESVFNESCGDFFNQSCYYDVRRIGWFGMQHADNGSGFILPEEVIALQFRFEIPTYSSANYNFTHVPSGFELDPPISACGSIASPGTYTLTTDITGVVGICFDIDSDDVILDMNGHTIDGDDSGFDSGVQLNTYDNFTVFDGIITDFLGGVNLIGSSTDITIRNISISSNTGGGIQTLEVENSIIEDCYIDVGTGFVGLQIGGITTIDNLTIRNNQIVNSAAGGMSIVGNDHLITGNNISGVQQGALTFAANADDNVISNNTFSYCNLAAVGTPACIVVLGDNNLFEDIIIDSGSLSGMYFSTSNHIVTDSVISNMVGRSVALTGSVTNITLINTTYDDELVPAGTELIRQWWYQANVTSLTTGNPIEGATVRALNNTGDEEFYRFTDASGFTQPGGITDYINASGTTTYPSNYSIRAFKSGYLTEEKSYNATLELNNNNDPFELEDVPTGNISASNVTNISVYAGHPDPIDKDKEGRFAIIMFNPTNESKNITRVEFNASGATEQVFNADIEGVGISYPTSGWNRDGAKKVVYWEGSETLPADSIVAFYVKIDPNSKDETFIVDYFANISGVRYQDPHNHTSEEMNGNEPFAELALDNGTAYPAFWIEVNNNQSYEYKISLEENADKTDIAADTVLTIELPTEFINVLPIGGEDWLTGTFDGQYITTNYTQTLRNAISPTYNFSAEVPIGGQYVVIAQANNSNARPVLEFGVKVNDVVPPLIEFVSPTTTPGFYSDDFILANVTSVDETEFENITIHLYNSTGLYQETTSDSSPYYFSFTSLPDDTYYLNATACDASGNCNITETREIMIYNTPPTLSNFQVFALNSSKGLIGGRESFNTSQLEEIEYMNISFTVSSPFNISGDIGLYFTANGTNGCSLGNKQSSTCFNFDSDSWIEFRNGTDTTTFDDQGASGDYIICDYIGSAIERNYTCQLDEHYNPNVFKWYAAEYNFSDVKWQDGNDQRITKKNMIKVELNQALIPLDADQYKLDFRVNYTVGSKLPTQPLEAYGCNSSYTTGDPETLDECGLIATKLPGELQDDGTKFRAVATGALIDQLGDIKYIILEHHENDKNKNYFIKTYAATAPAYTTHWEWSKNDGGTWANLGDGYETELNINWFYDGAEPTQILFKIESNDTYGNIGNSSIENMTWDIDPSQNYPPLLSLYNPMDEANVSGIVDINWTLVDPNNDNTLTNVTVNNATTTIVLALDLENTTDSIQWDASSLINGGWYINVSSCENETVELFCVNSSILVNLMNAPEITIHEPQSINYTTTNLDLNVTANEVVDTWWYSLNGGVNTTFTPNITIIGIQGGNNITVYANNSMNGIGSATVLFNIDSINPSLVIETPINTTYTNATQLVNITATDTNLDTVWYNWNGTNYTYSSEILIEFDQGVNTLFAWVNDTFGNINSTNVTFFVDSISPTLVIESPTNITYTNTTQLINITSDGDNIWYNWNGTNVTYTSSILTLFDEGVNTLYAWANDTFGNINSTNVTFFIDSIPPTLVIESPTNTTYMDPTQLINITSDGDNIWFNWNGTNVSYTVPTLTLFDEGVNILYAWANDTLGNINTTNVTFTIDSTAPTVNIIYPTATTYSSSVTELNYTVSGDYVNCWYSLDGGSTNVSVTCGNDVTGLSSGEGTFTWEVWSNDSIGNTDSDSVTFDVNFAPTLIVYSPLNTTYTSTDVNLSVYATDGSGIDDYWYSLDGGSDIIFTPNITLSTVGWNVWHNILISVNDTLGTVTSESKRFFVGDSPTPPPTPTITTCRYKRYGHYNTELPWFRQTGCV